MKALERIIKDRRCLVFLDLEGTQFTHEMIEIGAYKAIIKDDFSIKKVFSGYKTYVKAKNRIGKLVVEMTGITEEKLKKEGVPYRVAIQGLQKYLGREWDKCLFVTFGSHDLRIFEQSLFNNLDADKNAVRQIVHHAFDFSAFISQFIKDDNGNPFSLANYLKVMEIPFEGQAHDALADAYNLMDLYKAFLAKPEIVQREYMKTLSRMSHFPPPVLKVLSQLNEGQTVTPEDYQKAIEDYIK